MEIELLEIRDFLARHNPFNVLSAQQLDGLPRLLTVRYIRRGSHFPPVAVTEKFLYVVRSGAIELRDGQGNLHLKLAEGDYYSNLCQLVDLHPEVSGLASEDCLLYALPCEQLAVLRRGSVEFDQLFSQSLRERLRSAVSSVQTLEPGALSVLTLPLADLVKRSAVTVAPHMTVREAAAIMTRERVSSAVVADSDKPIGLITDSDLRIQCVAGEVSLDAPVSQIMSPQPVTISDRSSAFDALLLMSRRHINHLPVMSDGHLTGVITSRDLARRQSTSALFMSSDIHKAHTREELPAICARLPELQLQMSKAGVQAGYLLDALTAVNDALGEKLITLAIAELGPPPVAFAWVVAGSQARREQTIHSDQDNAIILAEPVSAEQEDYFARLAAFVSDGLNACGYVYCPGEVMATNQKWRQPLATWQKYFHEWIEHPEPRALMLASIFFDMRVLYGDKNLLERLQADILRRTRDNGIFIAYMAANALSHRPPLGFFRNFVLVHDGKHDDTLDIKHRGIVPIIDLARVYALSKGLPQVNTGQRLQAAVESGALSWEMGENLIDALEFIATLRVRHQAAQILRGLAPDNFLAPDDLSELERDHLKDAFAVIKLLQETLENRYQLGRFR